jgi:hypothetical protein
MDHSPGCYRYTTAAAYADPMRSCYVFNGEGAAPTHNMIRLVSENAVPLTLTMGR